MNNYIFTDGAVAIDYDNGNTTYHKIEAVSASFEEYREDVLGARRIADIDIFYNPEIADRDIAECIRKEIFYSLSGEDFFTGADWQEEAASAVARETGVVEEIVEIR